MKHSARHLATIFAFAALLLGAAGLALAEESESMKKEVTLSGRLSQADDGSYVLVERESGDEIALSGPEALGDHIGRAVRVTGQFVADANGKEVFAVSKVEEADE